MSEYLTVETTNKLEEYQIRVIEREIERYLELNEKVTALNLIYNSLVG